VTILRRALLAILLVGLGPAPSAVAAGRTQETTWHGNQIRMYDAQSAGRSGARVVVAVLDGWVDRSHPDFEGRALQGADCTSGTCVAGQGRDACTHGTHVAGTVASSSFGVAPKALVLPVRVLTDDGSGGCTGSPADVAAGIRWAVAHGAQVLNLSLGPDVPGLSSSSAIPTAVAEAARAGLVVVFSAGNADLPVAQAYGDDALIVAATGPSGRLASYSQHGEGVSVAAPGGQPTSSGCNPASCVTSLYPGGKYAVAAGTSMAAPHVSGLAALLFGQQPSRSRQNVMSRIKGTARALSGAGSGLVDARAALGVAATTPRPTATRSPAPAPPVVVIRPPAKPPTRAPVKPKVTKLAAPRVMPKPLATSPAPVPSASVPSPAVPSDSADLPSRAFSLTPPPEEVPVPLVILAAVLVALGAVGTFRAYQR